MPDHSRPLLLVTGGSRGIGAAVCALAARDGWDVALTYRSNRDEAERTAEAVRSNGGEATIHPCDTADRTAIEQLFAELDGAGGTLRGLVNNAGMINPGSPFIDQDPEKIARLYAVNTVGAVLVMQQAARRMAKSKGGEGGSIVNVSSIASRLGGAGASVDYSSSKGALDTATFGLGKELAREGIRVNAVRPGIIDTDIHADAGNPDRVEKLRGNYDVMPTGRAGTPEEVAETILFLLSDRASYVSNALLDVSGGR